MGLAFQTPLFSIGRLPPLPEDPSKSWLSLQLTRLYEEGAWFATAIVLSLTLVAGELHALDARASEHPQREDPSVVYSATAVGLIVVGFLALFGGSGRERKGD